MKRILLFLLLASCLAGCATVRSSTHYHGVCVENGARPLATLEIENTGWALFMSLPLASGDPDRPNQNTCRWFSNTVTLENNIKMLSHEMKRYDTKCFTHLQSQFTKENFLFILLTRYAYHTSAVLVDDDAKANGASPTKAVLP